MLLTALAFIFLFSALFIGFFRMATGAFTLLFFLMNVPVASRPFLGHVLGLSLYLWVNIL